jgi:hypothetical protein
MMVYKNFVNRLINFKLGTLSSPHPLVVDHFDGDSTVLGFVEGTPSVAVEGRLGESLSRGQQDAEKTYSPARCRRALRLVFSFQVSAFQHFPSCLMYAGFKRIAPEQDTGMDLNEPWITALGLFNAG